MIRRASQHQEADSKDTCTETQADPRDLLVSVYDQLHTLAASFMRQERVNHTLQPTALINEAWIRLAEQTRVQWQSPGHIRAVAVTMMRRILINHAHQHAAIKHGGNRERTSLTNAQHMSQQRSVDLIALDEALKRLAVMDRRQARIVELRYFGGLSIEETAEELVTSIRTVHREWASAKAWLRVQLSGDCHDS